MIYDIATLKVKLGTAAKALAGIQSFTTSPDAKGELLGVWTSEIGALNEIYVLRAYRDDAALKAERARLAATTNPFDCGEAILKLTLEAYTSFPFMPDVKPGAFGKVYEIRTYLLKHGGVEPTIKAWEAAVPERVKFSPLVAAFASTDGPPRITHIWPFESLDARAKARGDSVAAGVWPPKGGPDWLTGDMTSTLAIPAAFSPLK